LIALLLLALAIDATAKAIDARTSTLLVSTISAGQEHSLEGSTGEEWSDAGQVQKLAMTFYGETYRSELSIYFERIQRARRRRATKTSAARSSAVQRSPVPACARQPQPD
jgi:hypothetical protein